MNLFSLDHEVAMVTGCAGGIGQGIACGLAEAGADIIVIDLKNTDQTAELIRKSGRQCWQYELDLSDTAKTEQTFYEAVEKAGHLDILVNNAGMQFRESAYDFPLEMFDKIIAVNLRSAYQLSQLAGRYYRDHQIHGKIINLASLFSTFGGMNVSGYTCSKNGVVGLTKAFSNEFAKDGICVNALAPGYIATELTKSIWSDPEKRKPMDERIPAGRWGKPEDFKGAAVFLSSKASDYITGIVLPVDGGYTAR